MLTVGDLITELQKYPAHADVFTAAEVSPDIQRFMAKYRQRGSRKPKARSTKATTRTVSNLAVDAIKAIKDVHACHAIEAYIIARSNDLMLFSNGMSRPLNLVFSSQEDAFEAYLELTLKCQNEHLTNAIQLRFLMLFFHDLRTLHQFKNLKGSPKIAKLVPHLCSISQMTAEELEKAFAEWCTGGLKYHALTERLGIGVLFFLPSQVSKFHWEYTLPSHGPYFDQAVEHLQTMSFMKSSILQEANSLGKTMRSTMIRPFEFCSAPVSLSHTPGNNAMDSNYMTFSEDSGSAHQYQIPGCLNGQEVDSDAGCLGERNQSATSSTDLTLAYLLYMDPTGPGDYGYGAMPWNLPQYNEIGAQAS